jgi:hypothetical protein
LLLLLAPLLAQAEEPWKTFSVKEGITLARREVSGSDYYEYRAQVDTPASPKAVLEGIWTGLTEDLPKHIKKRLFIKRGDNEFIFYDQIRTPVVSDRDVVLHMRKYLSPDGGAAEVFFESVVDVGPPPDPKLVRLPVVHGGWHITRSPSGGSHVVYVCYSEPGGTVPALLVRGTQEDQVLHEVERMLNRARGR